MILVTGATGTIGRPLVDLLVREGAEVRAVTRKAQTASLPADVEVVAGDPARPDTLSAALQGVNALFLHPRAVARMYAALLGDVDGVRLISPERQHTGDPYVCDIHAHYISAGEHRHYSHTWPSTSARFGARPVMARKPGSLSRSGSMLGRWCMRLLPQLVSRQSSPHLPICAARMSARSYRHRA